MKKRGLGKGLDALFLDNETQVGPTDLLSITKIEPNKNQPRKDFNIENLAELADSIKMHGVIQPLIVRPLTSGQYQIVAGERRWRASRMVGLQEVPVVIKEMSDTKVMEIALIENLQRENLNPLEEALGFDRLIEEHQLTQEQVATSVGKSRSSVANTLRLLKLPNMAKEMLKNDEISKGHAKVLLSIMDEKMVNRLCEEIKKRQLSVRQLEALLKNKVSASLEKKPPVSLNTFFKEAELALSENLGTGVKIKESAKKKTIEIEFFSEEELVNIINQLSKI